MILILPIDCGAVVGDYSENDIASPLLHVGAGSHRTAMMIDRVTASRRAARKPTRMPGPKTLRRRIALKALKRRGSGIDGHGNGLLSSTAQKVEALRRNCYSYARGRLTGGYERRKGRKEASSLDAFSVLKIETPFRLRVSPNKGRERSPARIIGTRNPKQCAGRIACCAL